MIQYEGIQWHYTFSQHSNYLERECFCRVPEDLRLFFRMPFCLGRNSLFLQMPIQRLQWPEDQFLETHSEHSLSV